MQNQTLTLSPYKELKKYVLYCLEDGLFTQEEYTQFLGKIIQFERMGVRPEDKLFKQLDAAVTCRSVKSPNLFHYDFDSKGNIIVLKINPLKQSRVYRYKASSK
jgi:hypothetical protein